ncbi:MAG TPA: hypothetical protein VLG44_03340, partial [Chlamydiales bacterium]|nr:hypothetical protein [Chlamydiales bacterium]
MALQNQIDTLRSQFHQELGSVSDSKEIEQIRVRYLGKKGPLQNLMQELKNCPPQDKPQLGKLINDLKVEITLQIDEKFTKLSIQERDSRLILEKIDISLPGRRSFLGKVHPLSAHLKRAVDILVGMGFTVQ